MTDQAGPGATGPAAEGNRLLEAVQDWARRTLPAPPSGHPGPECQWCPLCQLASVLRGEHPELLERMAEAGAAVTEAVRALVENATVRGGGEPHPARRPERPRPRPGPRVQHITVTDPADPADPAEPEERT